MKNKILRVGIVGSRRRNTLADKRLVGEKLVEISEAYPDHTIQLVSGGCPKGGDRFADEFDVELGLNSIIRHLPDTSKLDPETLEKNPRAAYAIINYARNTLIAEDSDHLIACVAADRKGGTEDTVKKFIKFGKKEFLHLV